MEWGLRIKKLKFWGFTEKSDFKEGGEGWFMKQPIYREGLHK